MIKFFAKKLNKKGFTLAEMLIVIAIIAILVAIAIPIFTSELNKAKVSRDKANARNIKAAAVTVILDADKGYNLLNGPWEVKATISSEGKITIKSITEKKGGTVTVSPAYGQFVYDDTTDIIVGVDGTDLSGLSVTTTN